MNLPTLLKYFIPIYLIFYNVWFYYYDSVLLFWFTKLSAASMLAVFVWKLAYYLLERTNTETIWPTGKVVLVTGCSSGFGYELALRLDRFGFNVYAGMRTPDGEDAQRLQAQCSERLKVVKLDITVPEEVDAVMADIKASRLPLWAVVNNAGIAVGAFAEWGNDVELYRRQFETSVFGTVRVTKSCLPLLRESQGRIVIVGSVFSRTVLPGVSHYAMAKHATRVFADALRRELYLTRDQIKVVFIEPTFYSTKMTEVDRLDASRKEVFEESPETVKAVYREAAIEQWMKQFLDVIDHITRPDVNEVIEVLVKAVTLEQPKLFYRCCNWEMIFWAMAHLPEEVLDYANRYFVPVLAAVFKFVRYFRPSVRETR